MPRKPALPPVAVPGPVTLRERLANHADVALSQCDRFARKRPVVASALTVAAYVALHAILYFALTPVFTFPFR